MAEDVREINGISAGEVKDGIDLLNSYAERVVSVNEPTLAAKLHFAVQVRNARTLQHGPMAICCGAGSRTDMVWNEAGTSTNADNSQRGGYGESPTIIERLSPGTTTSVEPK